MHPNRAFAWDDRDAMLAFVADIAFCTICGEGPAVVHAPVIVHAPDRIRFHVARGNRAKLDGRRAVVSCLGPDAYVSPDWYGTPDQVPTWNYLAVEAEGPLRRLDEAELAALLDDLSAAHEARLAPKPAWTRAKMTPGRFEALLKAIIGYELTIEALRGTRKLGQHKNEAERQGAADGLAPFNPTMAATDARGAAVNRLAIFDCDGTLVDSQHAICAAMEECFAAAGRERPARERTRRIVGLSLIEAMREMAPDADHSTHKALAEAYKSAFQALRGRGAVEEPLFDGVAGLIDALEADGWLLGVATGKSDRGLAFCLEAHGLAGRFATLQTADRHPSKPHPSMIAAAMAEAGAAPQTTWMIGDTSYDMAMARAAGATAIGVAWGYHDADELARAGAHHIAADPADIIALTRTFA